MSKLINTAKQVRAGAKRLEWIGQLADALETVGSLEAAESNARQNLEKINAEFQAKQERLGEVEKSISRAEAGFEASKRALDKRLEANEAVLKRARIEAEDEAKAIVAKAQEDAKRCIEDADRRAKEVESQEIEVKKQVAVEQEKLDQLRAEQRTVANNIEIAKARAAAAFKSVTD